jgi:serine/threonine protein phosphatase 1
MASTQLASPIPPSVPEDSRLYAVGDIHGRTDLLTRMLARIAEDAAAGAPGRRVLIFLGDYVDRGPDSAGVLDILIDHIPDGFESVFLMGNHEQFMLDFLDKGIMGESWLSNGGRATFSSYGLDALGFFLGNRTLADLRADLMEALPDRHRRFLDGLRPCHREGDYFFVHAGVRPGIPLERQDPFDLLWIRGLFLNSRQDFGAVVVHGHSIEPEPDVHANRIGIDTGAYQSGRLTCLVLEGTARRFIVAR